MIRVDNVAVIGAGIMGNGIAQVAAQAGCSVFLMDLNEPLLEKGFASIRKSLGIMQTKGKITEQQKAEVLSRISGTTDFKRAVSQADLVIEVVPENLDLKKQVFKDLDKTCPKHAILATNTSGLSITAIGAATARPDKVLGMHFANPVPVMKAVELIRGLDTSDETLAMAIEFVKKVGKEHEVAKDFPGFAGSRMIAAFINEAFWILYEGISSAEDIDKHARNQFRHPMGPLELADFTGVDTMLSVIENLHKELGDRFRPCPLMKQLVAAGYHGRKSGRGVYKYAESSQFTTKGTGNGEK